MKNVWLLMKVQFGTAFDFNVISKKKNTKKKGYGFLLATSLFLLLFSVISFIYSYGMGTTLKIIGMLHLLPELMMAVTCIITIITTIYKVKGTLFGFKDYDLTMALPVKTSEIVVSRLLLLYMINFIFTLIIIVPNSIAYGILAKPTILFYVISVITVFMIPLVPMIVATIIGTIIAVIASRFRHSNFINIIITFAFFAAFMLLSFNFQGTEVELGELGASMTKQVDQLYPLAKMYRLALCEYNIVSLILFIGISIIAFLLFSWIVGIQFKKINTSMLSSYTKGNYNIGNLVQVSPIKALYKKELKRYFSSSIYIMNTAFGIVMMTIGAIATLFVSPEKIASVFEAPGAANLIGIIAPIVISICVVMTFTTACSISLEGKNLWILRTSPIAPMTIFFSKILVNLTITIPAIIINGIIIAFGLGLSLKEIIILFVMPISYAIFTAIFGLIINLHLPNLNWTTEVSVIKQSASSMVATFAGLAVVIIPMILLFAISTFNPFIMNGLVTIIMLLLSLISYRYLVLKGEELFTNLV